MPQLCVFIRRQGRYLQEAGSPLKDKTRMGSQAGGFYGSVLGKPCTMLLLLLVIELKKMVQYHLKFYIASSVACACVDIINLTWENSSRFIFTHILGRTMFSPPSLNHVQYSVIGNP